MKKSTRRLLAMILGVVLMFSTFSFTSSEFQKTVWGFEEETDDVENLKNLESDNAKISIPDLGYLYSGKAITPKITVEYDGIPLIQNTDYTVSYSNNINAGTAKYIIKGINDYTGTVEREFTILPYNLNSENVTIDDSNLQEDLEFNGKDRTPIVQLKYNGQALNPMADFVTHYENNFYPGTAKITIKGIGNFTGEVVKTFKIIKTPIGNVTIRTSFDSAKQLVVQVNNGSYAMTKEMDYTYTVSTDAEGNITITFTGLGDNYTGTCVRNIPADENPNKPVPPTVKQTKIKTIKNNKGKKVKLTWKKISGANGYKIRYSTNKKLKKAKTKTIKKNTAKYTIKKLKLKKKYYVQVRAYKMFNGKTYYGKWSKSKKIKITK